MSTPRTVWVALYNPCYHESEFGILSIHLTREGAEAAVAAHKAGTRKEWEELKQGDPKLPGAWDDHQLWKVESFPVLDGADPAPSEPTAQPDGGPV